MRDTAASRNNLLPYPVITAAVQGDPDAVNRVIGHYSGYIAALSTRTSYMILRAVLILRWTMICAADWKRS